MSSLPAVTDGHGGHQLTAQENFRRIMKDLGADKDPAAPPVGPAMTPELLDYLSRRLNDMDPGDTCYVLTPIAELKFAAARPQVIAFLLKHGFYPDEIYGALVAIGQPEDALAVAAALARRRSDWEDTKAEHVIEVLAGEDLALWRQVAATDNLYLQVLAAKHLAALKDVKVEELTALFNAGPVRAREAILEALAKAPRPGDFDLLLLALQDRNSDVAAAAFRGLKGRTLSEAERRAVLDLAERMHRKVILHVRLAAARLAAAMGDPRGFDWALECLRDNAESHQGVDMCCGLVPVGVPGEGPMVFLDYDRPGFANFLRLVRKGEAPDGLLAVAFMMSLRKAHGPLANPLKPETEEMQALRRSLEEIGTDLSRRIAATAFTDYPQPGLPAGLSEAEKKAVLEQEVGEKDFRISAGRRPFDKPNMIEFRLAKVTPGLFGCKQASGRVFTERHSSDNTTTTTHISSMPMFPAIKILRTNQGGALCVFTAALPQDAPNASQDLQVTFTLKLLDDRSLFIHTKYSPDQLRFDSARDADEFIRRLNSSDLRESDEAMRLFAGRGIARYRTVAPEGEARKRIVQALMKKAREWVDVEPKPVEDGRAPPVDITEAPGTGPLLCYLDSIKNLGGEDVPREDLEALLDAKDFWAARWASDALAHRFHNEAHGGAVGVQQMIDLLRKRTAAKNPYAARNAAAILRYAAYPPSLQKEWGDMVRPLLKSASPMVRAAGALLARVSDKFDCYDGEVLQYLAPLVDDGDLQVAGAAMIGLAEESGNLSLEKQQEKIAVFRRVVEKGDPARVKAAAVALEKIKDPRYVPLLYQAVRASGGTRAGISFPLDRDAAALLLDRLAADPADGLAVTMLVSSGYVWPPETRPGRLMKLLRDLGASKMPSYVEGAVTRLLTADKNDQKAAEAFAAALKKHLRCGEYWQAAEDCLALAALGVKTEAPIEELLLTSQVYGDRSTAAVVALYATDRESARAPLAALLREGWVSDQDSGLLFAVARHTPWPEVQAVGNKAAKD